MTHVLRRSAPDSATHHREWLALVATTGPFLSLPVLRRVWPSLDAVEKETVARLRAEHATWLDDPQAGQGEWIDFVLRELLGWAELLHSGPSLLEELAVRVSEHDATVTPSFALVSPGASPSADSIRLLGLICPPGQQPTARIPGDPWSATPLDRLAMVCRARGVPLGLVTDGRWWALVHAPRKDATATAVFDAVTWPEAAERTVLRAFVSLLSRRRFFGVPANETPAALFAESKDSPEDITEALGVQVRQAVELLVAAFGRVEVRDLQRGGPGLGVEAHEAYRGAVAVMMRIVFLLFAEERTLLPSDVDLYTTAYSASTLLAELEQQAIEGSEEELEHSWAAWQRLLALFDAVYHGIDHPRLEMHPHHGWLFDPDRYPWLPEQVDDRTVLHMLRAVQYVVVGTGKTKERRKLSFRSLDVEQIGYVYEGLLSFDAFHADGDIVGLVGKAGLEEEVPLTDLEAIAAQSSTVESLAAALADKYKESGLGSASALARRLASLGAVEREEALRRLLAVTGNDLALAQRLLPFAGIIRDDLRGLPMLILNGALYVTEPRGTTQRASTGTVYTPRLLAEEVVEGALEPLVYRVGPLQTADKDQWVPKSSDEILALKVADIACGSAAFLVAAARYLAGHLLEAWAREKVEDAVAYTERAEDLVDPDSDPAVIRARREIIEHCLYGVDINPMAVEMAKLSLWLVSMDSARPFTFVDDRIATGDSLLGIGNLSSLPPEAARDRTLERELAQVTELRRHIAVIEDTDDGIDRKQELLKQVEPLIRRATAYADLVSGARLASAKGDHRRINDRLFALAGRLATDGDPTSAEEQAEEWLSVDNPQGRIARKPLHWPLAFPEVFQGADGGFDALIGNPPFLGGKKVSGALGSAYREYLVDGIGRGVKGNADLIAFFALRAHDLLNGSGQSGLIATNTLAQGDTREVGLDQIVGRGVTIRRAVKSRPWPSRSAVLEFSSVFMSNARLDDAAQRLLDGRPVAAITASLDPESRVTGNAHRLDASSGIAFQGSNIVGVGFTLDPDLADALKEEDKRNGDVLMPFLNGQDLNSRADFSASRMIVNFRDMSFEQASSYVGPMELVRREVKPQRDKLPDYKRRVRENWWKYEHQARSLYEAIADLARVVAITRVSRTVMPVMVPTGQVIGDAVVAFATDDVAMLALLSGAPHYWWAMSRASAMRTDLRYTPSDVFETFPLPPMTEEMRRLGDELDTYRRGVMLARQSGLTATYNLVNRESVQDEDIVELRRIHGDIDEAVCRAYGWDDLVAQGLDHGFHDLGRGDTRYTVGPTVRQEILDRLLELNHERYAGEVAAGLHTKKKAGGRSTQDAALFAVGDDLTEAGDTDDVEQ